MGIFNGWNDPDKAARGRMEAAQSESRRRFAPESERLDSEGRPIPRRYKLYDRIASKVSVGTMNIVVIVVSLLLIAAIVVGIATGTPGQR